MDNLHLLLNYIFDFPAQKEYFIKIFINALDVQNREYRLFLLPIDRTNLSEINKNELGIFCDKVRVGETLEQAIKRALKDNLGIELVDRVNHTDIFDSDLNKKGELLPRYGVDVFVPYQKDLKNTFSHVTPIWIPVENLKEFLKDEVEITVETVLPITPETAQETIQQLESLGYFKFTYQEEKNKAKSELLKSLLKSEFYDFEYDEYGGWTRSLDNRIYPADEEDLFDGFISNAIMRMKEVLVKEGVMIESAEDEITDNDTHYLHLNGETYEIYKIDFSKPHDETPYWGIAHKRLLEIVNELLEQTGSKERLYAQFTGNDGRVIFLTQELYQYIKTLPLKPDVFPSTPEDIIL